MNSTTKLILIIFIVILSLAGLGLSIYSLLEPCKNEPFSSSPSPSPCANPLPISVNCSYRVINAKDYIANEDKIIKNQVNAWMISYNGNIQVKFPPVLLSQWRPPLLKCNDDDCQGSSIDICAKLNKGKNAFTKDVLDSLQKFMCENPSNSIVPNDYKDFTKGWKVA